MMTYMLRFVCRKIACLVVWWDRAVLDMGKRIIGYFLAAGAAIFFLWWVVTAFGAAAGIVITLAELWHTAVLVWVDLDGWKKVYALGGAVSTAALSVLYGPSAFRALVEVSVRSPIEGLVLLIFAGSSLIIVVPVVFIGWPFIIWYALSERRIASRKAQNENDETHHP